MDRRFLLFVILSLLLLIGNTIWNAKNMPKQPAPAAGAAAPKDGADAAKAGPDAEKADPPEADDANVTGDVAPETEAAGDAAAAEDVTDPAAENDAAGADDADAEPAVAAEPQVVTLGSLDPASPYRMLVTLTNEGAAVRRIELSSPRYLDLHDRGGYLGQLDLKAGGGTGLLVQSVGVGTPAAEAGLQVRDRIVEAGASEKTMKAVAAPAAFAKLVDAIKPGREVRLVIDRDGARQTLTAKLRRRPLDVVRPESENWRMRGLELPAGFTEPPSLLMTLQQVDDDQLAPEARELPGVDLARGTWDVAESSIDGVTFVRALPDLGLKVSKRYELAKLDDPAKNDVNAPVYHLTLTITIENEAGGDAVARAVAYRLDGPNGLPVEGWWYATKSGRSSGSGLRDVVGRKDGAKPIQQSSPAIADGKVEPFEPGSLAYIGVDAQYVAAALIPDKKSFEEEWIATVESILVGPKPDVRAGGGKLANVTCRLTSDAKTLEPGESITHSYKVFAGPKRPELLAKYYAAEDPAYSLSDYVYYGWFGGVAKAMVGMLHVFYGWVGNYGVAIVMLTVLVRGCMFPITRGQAKSMARMQELKPEMERIKERYKGDQQKQAKAMQELYRKHNVNPLAGCLPMLIQLPVFMGLYRGLAVDVELRQAPLFGESIRWCSNLAAPDMAYNWSAFMPAMITSGEGFFGLGPYLNVLPLITIALFLLQQKMFMPPATDEQGAMQQKIMKYMMVFMGLMFYKVPSGLCLYFIASSLWGIAERKLVPPAAKPMGLEVASSPRLGSSADDKRASKNGQSGAGRDSSKTKRRK